MWKPRLWIAALVDGAGGRHRVSFGRQHGDVGRPVVGGRLQEGRAVHAEVALSGGVVDEAVPIELE